MPAPLDNPRAPGPSADTRARATVKIPFDYHIHTHFSSDCETPLFEVCHSATALGLPEIGITEHFDLLPEDPSYGYLRFDEWWQEIDICRRAFTDMLTIRAGIEIGEPHRFPLQVGDLQAHFPWDYCLGALHWVAGTLIWDRAYYERSQDQAYGDYFAELADVAAAGGFDILAHMDVIKHYGSQNYGPFDPRRYEAEIRTVLRTCARQGIALEVNSGLLRRPIAELSPETLILSWFRDEGGARITIGSDAHRAEHVGLGLDRAVRTVRAAGFDQLTAFHARQPHSVHLGIEAAGR